MFSKCHKSAISFSTFLLSQHMCMCKTSLAYVLISCCSDPRDHNVQLFTSGAVRWQHFCVKNRPNWARVRFGCVYMRETFCCLTRGVDPVWRSRTSKVSGSCQNVSGSWRRLARRYATSSSPERRSTYAHARRTGVTSGGRSECRDWVHDPRGDSVT